MNSSFETTIGELIDQKILFPLDDGNHGEIHPKISDYVKEGIPFLMASDLTSSKIDLEKCVFITSEQAKSLRKGVAKEGDVLLSHKGTIGRVSILSGLKSEFAILTPQITRYRIRDKSKLLPEFLKYYFKNKNFQKILSSWSGAGSTRPYLSITSQRDLPIKLFDITFQKKVIKIISSLEEKIELNKQSDKFFGEILKTLFKSWFVDFDPVKAKFEGLPTGLPDEINDLFPNSFEDSKLGRIPRGWCFTPFEKLVTKNKVKIKNRKATVLSAVSSGDLVPSEKYFTKKVYSKNISNYIAINKYDIAYNPSRINIGSIGIHYEDYLGAVSPIYNVVTPNPGWHWFLLMSIKRDYFNKNVKVLASGSVRQSLSMDDFLSISIATPSTSSPLITHFNRFYDLILKRQTVLNKEKECLQDISEILLPKIILGEIRIPDNENL